MISEDQVGYIKGRHIGTTLRTIDDAVNYLNKTGKAGYLLALDFSKAFDSVSKTYILHAFKLFGFGVDFQKWVSVLTSGSQSCINHGGWLSTPFDVNCGIRQGCPFSPLAFVLSVELLAIKIRNSDILGIKSPTSGNIRHNHIKIKQLADDTTLFLNNKEDMVKSYDILKTFQAFSGLKLNREKTKALKIGGNIEQNLPFLIVDKIKILGIYFQSNKMAKCIEENWTGRIENIQKMIKDWSRRDLSIHGKIVVIKTFLMSQLIFVMQAIGLPEDILNKVNTMLYTFLWQRKHSNKKAYEKVKRTVMESDYEAGGLKMVNVVTLQKCMYLQWVGRLYSETEANWTAIPKWHLNNILSSDATFLINCKSKDVNALEQVNNDFWKTAISTYLNNKRLETIEDINQSNVLNQMLFYNNLVKYKSKVLSFKRWKEMGIQFIRDIVHVRENRLLNQEEIETLLGSKSGTTIFELNALKNAIPSKWIEWINNNEVRTADIRQIECDAASFNIKPKQIKKLLNDRSAPNISSNATCFWRRKLDFDLNKEVWLTPRSCTNEIRLLELQWKINNNIYPTNILLEKMKVTETNKCDTCVNETDYIEHFFFNCPLIKRYWSKIETIISAKIGVSTKLSVTEVLFGIQNVLTKGVRNMVNHIILIGKMCISIARKTKSISALQLIFEYHMMLRSMS